MEKMVYSRKYMMCFLLFFCSVGSMLTGCSAALLRNSDDISGYNLEKPERTLDLPDTLREISGLTVIDSITVACIQDENGILFIYDLAKNVVRNQYIFNIDGDYEGITRVDNTIFILRSDGDLFEITNFSSPDYSVQSYTTGIPADNNEGLCYDADNNRLLIACKGKLGKGPEYKDKRVIYSFDLATKLLSESPVFEFNLADIKNFALLQKTDLPTRTKKNTKEPILKFRPSAIGIHPGTGQLFVISASDHCLFIFDKSGIIVHIELLDPGMFNKAEGITFFRNGDMMITNEGQDKQPTLLYFRYRK